jgi:hypothetical protein
VNNLVSDLPGVAAFQDPNLVNPWGLASSTASPIWVSDNGMGVATAVPEPSTWAVMLLGFAGLGFAFRQSLRKGSFA